MEGRRRNTPAVISGLFEKNAYGEGKARWGDKTPYYVLHLPKIIQWFPGVQFIHLIRDGRDCSLSLINRRHDFNVYNTYQAAKYWQHYVRVGREHGKRLGPDTYIETRYEDLLDNPAGTMMRICTFLGEEYTESLVHFNKANQAGKTPLLQKPVQTDNAGKWRNQMSRATIRAFESVAATRLQTGLPGGNKCKASAMADAGCLSGSQPADDISESKVCPASSAKAMKLTVVVCTHNRAPLLARTLNSLNQAHARRAAISSFW